MERASALIHRDIIRGYISEQMTREEYGWRETTINGINLASSKERTAK